MSTTSVIKCPSCGTFNRNLDYCSNCGALINPELLIKKSVEKRKKAFNEQLKKEHIETQNTFFYKLLNHRFWLVRIVASVLYSVWIVIMAIGSFLAWLAAAISA